MDKSFLQGFATPYLVAVCVNRIGKVDLPGGPHVAPNACTNRRPGQENGSPAEQ